MKTIVLLRHAKAEPRKGEHPDFERTLVNSGKTEAKEIAKTLKKEGIVPDLFITSPANRALETAVIFAKIVDYAKDKIMHEQSIYNETDGTAFLKIVKDLDDQFNTVLFCGHEPTLSEFASYLTADFEGGLPKTGTISLEFDANTWQQISKGKGKISLFLYPWNKTQKIKIETEVHEKLIQAISYTLNQVDEVAASKMTADIKDWSKKLTKRFLKLHKRNVVKFKKAVEAEEFKPEPVAEKAKPPRAQSKKTESGIAKSSEPKTTQSKRSQKRTTRTGTAKSEPNSK